MYNPTPTRTYDPSAAYEVYLKPELANPHSRAKKMQRFKLRQAIIHAQLKDITDLELANLEGRTPKQARSDAAFRWRELVKKQLSDPFPERGHVHPGWQVTAETHKLLVHGACQGRHVCGR